MAPPPFGPLFPDSEGYALNCFCEHLQRMCKILPILVLPFPSCFNHREDWERVSLVPAWIVLKSVGLGRNRSGRICSAPEQIRLLLKGVYK